MQEKLADAYKNAVYSVTFRSQQYRFQVGQVPSALDPVLKELQSAVFITAFNPESQLCNLALNHKNNRRLCTELTKEGYVFLSGTGGDKLQNWPDEESYLVFDMEQVRADRLAKKYGQNAYLWVEKAQPVRLIWV